MMKKLLPAALVACALVSAVLVFRLPAAAAPLSPGVSPAETLGNPAEPARLRWRRRHSRHASGVGVFIVPGLYWGPAWWDKNYSRACWRNIRPCKNCARNWVFTC